MIENKGGGELEKNSNSESKGWGRKNHNRRIPLNHYEVHNNVGDMRAMKEKCNTTQQVKMRYNLYIESKNFNNFLDKIYRYITIYITE